MRSSDTIHVRSLILFSAALALAAGMVTSSRPTLAQDGVAGAPPVFSQPRKPPLQAPKVDEELAKIKVQSPLVTAPVTVLDSSGEFVYDLEEKDFQVLDNGVPQRIDRFDAETDTLAAVILVQTNEAVAPLLGQVRPLGSVFSSLLLGPKGEAAVIFFDDRVRVAQDFTSDPDRLAATLRSVSSRGDQARLNDALGRAIAMLEKQPREERRVIIAFADGFDRGSQESRDEIVRRATDSEVTIYGLGFSPAEALLLQKPQPQPDSPLDTNVTRPLPPGMAPTPTNSANVWGTPVPVVPIMISTGQVIRSVLASSLLEFYSGYTGGVFHSHWSKTALQEQLSKIASEIHSQYELAYVPDTLSQTGFHRIEIQVKRPGVKVRTRAGYFYGEKSP
jgi:VWFA-related protein